MSSSPSTQSNSRPVKILVVDDEGSILLLVRRVLTHEGYEVTMCATAEEALNCLEQESHHCVITDAIMPEISGYDLTQRIRSHPVLSKLPIIMLTRIRNKEDIQKAIQMGVNDYIVKPIDEQLLIKKVAFCVSKLGEAGESFELLVQDMMESEAILDIACRITHLNELGLKIQSPVPLRQNLWFQLRGMIFDSIGIETPYLKVVDCTASDDPEVLYEVRLSFIGLKEKDGSRIRAWMIKEAMSRKKRNPLDPDSEKT